MSLADHLRELRYRVIVSVLVVIVASVIAAIWYEGLYQVLMLPYLRARDLLAASNPDIHTMPVISGVTAPFTLALKVCVVAGLAASSPVWLYQLWAFIVPALREREKKYTLAFLGTSIPLFLAGMLVGYYILPQGMAVLIGFTPSGVPVSNLLDVNQFLSLLVQLMVVFGLGFLVPVVVVAANMIGVLTAARLKKVRVYVVFGIFVFGAVATPSTDPFSMLALALPMVALYLIAEAIAHVHDKRKLQKADT